jgi:hypothetical protein
MGIVMFVIAVKLVAIILGVLGFVFKLAWLALVFGVIVLVLWGIYKLVSPRSAEQV